MSEKVRKILTLVGSQVDQELHEQLQAQAKREDRSTASIIRQALKMYLKLNDNK
mgnify:CR=1 FL=1